MGIIDSIFGSSPKKPVKINQNAVEDSTKSINSLTKENDYLENNIKGWKLKIINAESKIKENEAEIKEHEHSKDWYMKKDIKEKSKRVITETKKKDKNKTLKE